MKLISGSGYNFFDNRAYAFDVPLQGGSPSTSSTKVVPTTLGTSNVINNVGHTNNRGTPDGSKFYNVGIETLASVKKQAVNFSLEQVISDGTGNFVPGEYLLRVETKISDGTTVEVSNIDFSAANSVDVFKVPGRPIGKL